MVLITDVRHRSGGSNAQVHPAPTPTPRPPEKGLKPPDSDSEEEDEEAEEVDFDDVDDRCSVLSDDSFYPPDDYELLSEGGAGNRRRSSAVPAGFVSFYQACSRNNPVLLRAMMRQGVGQDQVMETDRNHRTGLMIACYQGYVDVVMLLAQCPHLDVNWQDSEGNTALITAAQAGHVMITNYLLNYFSGLDLERKNVHGFTALMKAAMQGRVECVRALMNAGSDLNARDFGRGMTASEWAFFTGRQEAAWVMARLVTRPCPRQMSIAFSMEWPQLRSLVEKAQERQGYVKRAMDQVKSAFNFANVNNPQDHGVIDHLVATTTSLKSPFIAMACHTVCPENPPCVGVRRYAVPEIVRSQRAKELQAQDSQRSNSHQRLFDHSRVTPVNHAMDHHRSSLQPGSGSDPSSSTGSVSSLSESQRRASLMPLHTVRRSSVRPAPLVVPKVFITKAPTPTYHPEKTRRKSSYRGGGGGGNQLDIPQWRYKEAKEQRKKAEDMERRRKEDMEKEKK